MLPGTREFFSTGSQPPRAHIPSFPNIVVLCAVACPLEASSLTRAVLSAVRDHSTAQPRIYRCVTLSQWLSAHFLFVQNRVSISFRLLQSYRMETKLGHRDFDHCGQCRDQPCQCVGLLVPSPWQLPLRWARVGLYFRRSYL